MSSLTSLKGVDESVDLEERFIFTLEMSWHCSRLLTYLSTFNMYLEQDVVFKVFIFIFNSLFIIAIIFCSHLS